MIPSPQVLTCVVNAAIYDLTQIVSQARACGDGFNRNLNYLGVVLNPSLQSVPF